MIKVGESLYRKTVGRHATRWDLTRWDLYAALSLSHLCLGGDSKTAENRVYRAKSVVRDVGPSIEVHRIVASSKYAPLAAVPSRARQIYSRKTLLYRSSSPPMFFNGPLSVPPRTGISFPVRPIQREVTRCPPTHSCQTRRSSRCASSPRSPDCP
jgi:hypothetical protein